MNDILTQHEATVNPDSVYFIVDAETDLSQLLDGVYPFDGGAPRGEPGAGDQWVVVIDCQPIGWAQDWSKAAIQEIEALRVRREHARRCPDDFIPFDGSVDEPLYYDDEELLFASSADLYGLNEATL